MMTRRISITAKFILIGCIVILFFSAYTYWGFLFTHHIKDDAARINMSGTLRYRTFEMLYISHEITMDENDAIKEKLIDRLRHKSDRFSEILSAIKNGNDKAMLIKPLPHKELLEVHSAIEKQWENEIKPGLMDAERHMHGRDAGDLDLAVSGFVGKIDGFVNSLVLNHEKEIKINDRVRFYITGAFALMVVFLVFYLRGAIVIPVKRLWGATSEIEKGNYGVKSPVSGSDEIGELSERFNRMSGVLEATFSEIRKRTEELSVISKVALAAGRSLSIEKMAGECLDALLSLDTLKLVEKGAVFVCDERTKTLKLIARRNFSPEHERLCTEVPYGECLCGRCAKEGTPFFSGKSIESGLQDRTYPDMVEHGHVILPLTSKGKKIGVLCLYTTAGTKTNEKEKELFNALGAIITTGLENAINHAQVSMLAQSLESSIDLVVITDTSGKITYANQPVVSSLGYGREEFIGKNVSIMQSPNNPPGIGEEIYKESLKDGWFGEVINMRKEGSEYPVLLTTSPVRDAEGNIIALIGVSRDITVRKQMEEQLKKYSEGLERMVDERTMELEEARLQAEAANKAKSDFLANMSHELRTPLNSILGFSRLMSDGAVGPLNEEQKDYTNDIVESGDHLLGLINEILDLSKIEAGKLELELSRFDPVKAVESVMGMFREKALKHGIKTEIDVEGSLETIIADETKIKQILINLLGNAFKFTPDGGTIKVTARRTSGPPEAVEVSVEDTGIGIKEEDMPRLFQPFSQLQSILTKEHKGTGLGLALTKKLVELHGGSIRVESAPGRGSRFIFVIPFVNEEMIRAGKG